MYTLIATWISIFLPLLQATTQADNSVLEPVLNRVLFNSDDDYTNPNVSFFPLITSVADELGLIPKEFIENGLHFTLLAPSILDMLAVGTQVLHHAQINFAHGFDRLIFGAMSPETLKNQSYVRTFPGSKLQVSVIANESVAIGKFLVDLRAYISLFDRFIIYYKISPEPK